MNDKKTLTLLFNPFVYIAGAQALYLGLAAILLAGLIGSLSNTHFDGVLDAHTGAEAPLWVFLVAGIINWLCMGLVLLLLGRLISRTSFRTIDLVGTQALARWPALIMSLIFLPKAFQRFSLELAEWVKQGGSFPLNTDAIIFFVVVIAVIPLVCWMVVLMYKSFSISCNVKGGKAIGTFIAGLLVAEVLSKLCLALVLGQGLVQATVPAHPASGSLSAPGVQTGASKSSTEAGADFAGSGAQFVDLLVKEDFAGAVGRFDAKMKRAMPEASLRKHWQTLLKEAGPFQKQLGTRVEEQQGYQIVFVTCQFERTVLDMKVVFNSQKQVAGLFYVPSQTALGSLKPKGN